MQGRSDSESAWFPAGLQAVSIADPNWAHDKDSDDWKRVTLSLALRKALKKSLVKPLNYPKLSGVTQEKKGNLTTSLERLGEALRKHTYLGPDSPEGQLILKDKFVTQ